MVSFTALVTAALALVPSAIAAPAADSNALRAIQEKGLTTRQGSPWQWWTEGSGQFSCQQQGGGKYTCNWSGQPGGGMVAGTGWRSGRKTVKYSGSYKPKGPGYLSLYGWTRNPLVEFYIVESWDILAPGEPWTLRGNYTSEGTAYAFYTAQRVNKPSIEGTRTFTQYFSVRDETKKVTGDVSGTINTGDHFDFWASKGYRMGNLEQNFFMITEAFANGTKLPSGTSTCVYLVLNKEFEYAKLWGFSERDECQARRSEPATLYVSPHVVRACYQSLQLARCGCGCGCGRRVVGSWSG